MRRDVRGPKEQGAGMVEMLFLDVVISVCHQSVDLLVTGQQLKALRACPSLWKKRSAERRAVKSIALCKLTCLIRHKSHKFLSISALSNLCQNYPNPLIMHQYQREWGPSLVSALDIMLPSLVREALELQ